MDSSLTTLSADELERRRTAWSVLSRLFLDAELSDDDCRAMAAELSATGYSTHVLLEILKHELGPLLYTNWLSVAGEWEGFDIRSIEASILAGRHLTVGKWYRVLERWRCRRVMAGIVGGDWNRVAAFIEG